jgi:tetratricopeptide (TPR) repeat protein
MDKELLFDKIEAFLNNALSPDDKKAFEAEIARDEDLATAVAMHRLEHEGLERILENELRKNMKTWQTFTPLVGITAEKPVEKPVQKPRFSWKWAVAAVGLLGLGVLIYMYLILPRLTMRMPNELPKNAPIQYDTNGVRVNPQTIDTTEAPVVNNSTPSRLERDKSVKTPQKPLEQPIIKDNSTQPNTNQDVIVQNNTPSTTETEDKYLTDLAEAAYTIPSETLTRGNNPADALSQASDAFAEKAYQKAIDLTQTISPSDGLFAQSLVIKAHAYFKLKQYEKAGAVFQELVRIGKPYSEDAEWYIILCYLTDYTKHKSTIQTRLNKILNDSEHPHFVEAKEIQKKIQR